MNTSVCEITAEQFKFTLNNMKAILVKANKWADSKKIDMSTVFGLRLAPDMLPLGRQIQIACDNAKGSFTRLTGQPVPVFEDKETTYDDYMKRIDKTIEILDAAKPELFMNFEKTKQEFPWNPGVYLTGKDYLTQFLIPNFYFHVSIFYAILRKNGLDIGKGDYIGMINFQKKA